jgi:hypothetical protein
MIKWIIIVTFAASSQNANDPTFYTKTPHAERAYTQAILDTKGRLVWFDTANQCLEVMHQVLDKMIMDVSIVPKSGKCITTKIQIQ